jgi:NAD(P)-dependent dehydrogenase (short-subunit alcohol dehydrogenase family)
MDAPLIQCDVTKPEEVEQTFALVKERFGRLGPKQDFV